MRSAVRAILTLVAGAALTACAATASDTHGTGPTATTPTVGGSTGSAATASAPTPGPSGVGASPSGGGTPSVAPVPVHLRAGDAAGVLPTLGEVRFGWSTVHAERYLLPFRLAVTEPRCQAALDAFDPLVAPAGAEASEVVRFSDLQLRFRALVVRVSVFGGDQTAPVRRLARESTHCRSMTGARRHRRVVLSPGLGVPLGAGYAGVRLVDHDVPPVRMHWSSVLVAVGNARVTVSEVGYARLRDAEVADVARAAVSRAEALRGGAS